MYDVQCSAVVIVTMVQSILLAYEYSVRSYVLCAPFLVRVGELGRQSTPNRFVASAASRI